MNHSQTNPSMQCSVCGQWKRLTRTTGPKAGMQTFYPVCGDDMQYEHIKPVCDECCKGICPYRYRDVVVIISEYRIARDVLKPNMWTAKLNGEVLDYHSQKVLIEHAERDGRKWVVLRSHKDGSYTIIKQSPEPAPNR
jgi:hypothetical protein